MVRRTWNSSCAWLMGVGSSIALPRVERSPRRAEGCCDKTNSFSLAVCKLHLWARHTHTQRGQCWVRGPPPSDVADHARRALSTIPPLRCYARERSGCGRRWTELPDELFEKVLELLQPAGPSKPQDGGLGFSQALAVRLVCAGWKAVHDAMVSRLVLSPQTTDEAVGMLVGIAGAAVPGGGVVEVKGYGLDVGVLTDEALRAVSSLTSLTHLDLSWCGNVTDEGYEP
jgi:hypothetical protein